MPESINNKEQIRHQLAKMLSNDLFREAPRCGDFLKHIVEETLEGRGGNLTEFAIAEAVFNMSVEVFTAPEQPRGKSIVRQTKNNLDERLTSYYICDGQYDPVLITLHKRSYIPSFQMSGFYASHVDPVGKAVFDHLVECFKPENGILRCVVSSDEAVWHYLDGNARNNTPGNIIPLSSKLISMIADARSGCASLPSELAPDQLKNISAPQRFRERRPADAYACAYLAYHLGQPPLGDDSHDTQILRLCDALYYARHHENGEIISAIIKNSLLPLIADTEFLDAVVAYRLSLELIPLFTDSLQPDHAAEWISFTEEKIIAPFGEALKERGALYLFSNLRRKAELFSESPDSRAFQLTVSSAIEHANGINARLAINTVIARRLLKFRTKDGIRAMYEDLSDLLEQQGRNSSQRPGSEIDPANISTIMNELAFATCILEPENWKRTTEELLHDASTLREKTGHRLSSALWRRELAETAKTNPRGGAILGRSIAPHLAQGTDQLKPFEIRGLLRCLRLTQLYVPDSIVHYNRPKI